MHILYISHRFPYPPTHGARIRAFNVIRHLSRDHRVTVAAATFSDAEADEGRALAEHCDRVVTERVHRPVQVGRMIAKLPTLDPSTLGYFHSPHLGRRIDEILMHEAVDMIIVHCSSVAHYVSNVRGIPKILDFVDMDSQKWLDYARFRPFPLSLGFWVEGRKLERVEKRLARRFDVCTVTTKSELDTLQGFETGACGDWFPNGVDTEYFQPGDESYDPDTICFLGRMNYYPNQECMLDFCANTLPLVRAKRPDTRLLIVGADPSKAVRRLATVAGVTVTGAVDDVRPYLRQSALMVAPLNIARGTQNKILEAMAAGTPVIASGIAAAGVDAVAREHLLVARSPQEYAAAILELLQNQAERRRLAAAGRQRVLTNHSWASAMQRLDNIVHNCMTRFRKRRTGLQTSAGRHAAVRAQSLEKEVW